MVDPVIAPTAVNAASDVADATVDATKKVANSGFFTGLLAPFTGAFKGLTNLWGWFAGAAGIFGASTIAGQEVVAAIPVVGPMIGHDMQKDHALGAAKDAAIISAFANAGLGAVTNTASSIMTGGISGMLGSLTSIAAIFAVVANVSNAKDIHYTGNADSGSKQPPAGSGPGTPNVKG